MKSKSLAFFLSFIVPGVGHLYLGLQRRGLQLMGGAFLCIALTPQLPMIFPFILAMIWFFGLFDVLQQVTRLQARMLSKERDPMSEDVDASAQSQESLLPAWNATSSLWIGIAFVALGLLLLLRILFPTFWNWLAMQHLGGILLAIGIILVGLYYLRRHWRGV